MAIPFHDRRSGEIVNLGRDIEGTNSKMRLDSRSTLPYDFFPTKPNPTEVAMKLPGAEQERVFPSMSALAKHPRMQKHMRDEGQGVITRRVIAPLVAKGYDMSAKSVNKSARKHNKRTGDRLRRENQGR
jgi:hypothetical protein